QTIKPRDARGRPRRVETRATCGAPIDQPALGPVERRTGACRDRLHALTRTTHAFATTTTTWDALVEVPIVEQTWRNPPRAFREPVVAVGRLDDRRTPAMALRLTDHVWSRRACLTTPTRVSS